MSIFFGNRDNELEDIARQSYLDERLRLDQMTDLERQRAEFLTTEGEGISKRANIDLGFDDEDEDLLFGEVNIDDLGLFL